MPELPDVAVFQRYLESTSLHQTIDTVTVEDRDVLLTGTPRRLASVAEGHAFESTLRHGKLLFVELSDEQCWIEMHFGMTGQLKYYKNQDQEPEYARTYFHFDNAFTLAYVSQRKLGHIAVVRAPRDRIRQLELGPDALNDARDWTTFRQSLGGGRGRFKSILMTQEKLAGIGNVYSDEILYHAHIHPNTELSKLQEADFTVLHRSMIKVLEMAVDRRASVSDLPRTWLLPHRQGTTP